MCSHVAYSLTSVKQCTFFTKIQMQKWWNPFPFHYLKMQLTGSSFYCQCVTTLKCQKSITFPAEDVNTFLPIVFLNGICHRSAKLVPWNIIISIGDASYIEGYFLFKKNMVYFGPSRSYCLLHAHYVLYIREWPLRFLRLSFLWLAEPTVL